MSAIRDLVRKARGVGAENITAVATSAIRDSRDGEDFIEDVESETGVEVRTINGDREAELTYLGAMLDLDVADRVMVADIGGGSSEIIQAGQHQMQPVHSLQIGSGRLTERFVSHDPPDDQERRRIAEEVQDSLSILPTVAANLAVFTGGTASHIVKLMGHSERLVPIEKKDIGNAERLLLGVPSREIAERYDIRRERAVVLPAGVIALRTVARWSGASSLCITRNGIREGIIVEELKREGLW